ncbi:MAG: DUF935 family protein [Planctomycetia bacterium]|nr:MAG: DUF935 family protein [Planctomycetia bacterium]
MRFLDRIVNAVRGAAGRPASGVMVSRGGDWGLRAYPADGLTPQRLLAIFREADAGDLGAQLALSEQMEEKDAHLFSVAATRRLAVTGLPWRVSATPPGVDLARPAAGAATRPVGGGASAQETAAYCESVLRDLPGFEETLAHLSLATGRGLAVAEIVWEADGGGVRPVEIVPVPFDRLTLGDSGELRVLTEDEKYQGEALPPNKFVVHAPQSASGHPLRGGLARVTGLAYLAKRFAIKDWLIFAEAFGMPVRIARYEPGATSEEKREMLAMLKQLGADATGVFSKAIQLEIIQSRVPGEVNLFENLCLYFDREISKAWLGQTLTTDTARMLASAGAAKVHDHVRRDLRDDDIRREAQTLRRDLLGPLVRMQFGPGAAVPYFERQVEGRLDARRLAEVLDIAVNRLGARVPATWAHQALGVPVASAGESVLAGGADGEGSGGGNSGQE